MKKTKEEGQPLRYGERNEKASEEGELPGHGISLKKKEWRKAAARARSV